MKFIHYRLHTTILSLMITLSVPLSAHNIKLHDQRCLDVIQSVSDYLYGFGTSISTNFHSLVEYFEDIFLPHDTKQTNKYDVTLVGFVNFADGIGRHPILFKQCLEDSVTMNFLSTRNIPAEIEDAQLGLPRLNPSIEEDIGTVAILTDIIADKALDIYKKMPDSKIKIAYSMFESTAIPYNWATILNNKFDMVVVPDQFLVDVYKDCGVQIPIFVMPLPLLLQDFLDLKAPKNPHKVFTFGVSGGFWKRKNHIRVLEAFAAEFGNRKDVKLVLHGRFGEQEIIKKLADTIAEKKLTNVELIVSPYTWDEYLKFFKSIDCYIMLSMGEGFSITPRESLACAKPCIITNNTGQTTICNTGFVRTVPSNILVPADYDCHYDATYIAPNGVDLSKEFSSWSPQDICKYGAIDMLWRSGTVGSQFDCTVEDAQSAMRDVYKHYPLYLKKALQGRKWVQGYLAENLRNRYVNLVKPQSIILGKDNIIGDTFFMTNSKTLYDKYCQASGE